MKQYSALCLLLCFLLAISGCGYQVDPASRTPAASAKPAEPVTTQSEPQSEREEILMDEIVGTWHASNMVAAGFSDCYVFLEDGQFYFLANQMVYHQMVNAKGTWSLDGDYIVLTITDKVLVKDFLSTNEGSLHPDTYEYETEIIRLEEAETVMKLVTKPEEDTETPHYSPAITIGGRKYWNFAGDTDLTEVLIGAFDTAEE